MDFKYYKEPWDPSFPPLPPPCQEVGGFWGAETRSSKTRQKEWYLRLSEWEIKLEMSKELKSNDNNLGSVDVGELEKEFHGDKEISRFDLMDF
jgi:hypothetical protein